MYLGYNVLIITFDEVILNTRLLFLGDNFFQGLNKAYFLISWRLITSQYCSGFCHINLKKKKEKP